MKIKFLLILIFLSVKFSACKCKKDVIAQDYFESDVVGIITIESTYGNEIRNDAEFGSRTYKAKISFDKIFKGKEFEELIILGTTESISSGACEKLVKAGQKYLILLNKGADGKYIISFCSNIYGVSNENSNEIKKYNNVFRCLEENKTKFQDLRFLDFFDTSRNWDDVNKKEISGFINTFGKKLNNKFGFYKIKLDSENNITEVNSIKKIGLDEKKVSALIKKNIKVYYPSYKNSNSEYLLFLDF